MDDRSSRSHETSVRRKGDIREGRFMTDLSYNNADFWLYTVQLARRGLFPVDFMKAIRGPHRHSGKPWRHVECAFHEDRRRHLVRFVGADTWNGVRFEISDNPELHFPVLKPEERTARAERWLSYAVRRTGDRFKDLLTP
jgi:hypothetical protein